MRTTSPLDQDGLKNQTVSATSAFHYDVFLSHNSTDKRSGEETIRWMNLTRYLKSRKNKKSRQIVFKGEELDMQAVWRLRDEFFPPGHDKAR